MLVGAEKDERASLGLAKSLEKERERSSPFVHTIHCTTKYPPKRSEALRGDKRGGGE